MTELEKWAKDKAKDAPVGEYPDSYYAGLVDGAKMMLKWCADEAAQLFDAYAGPHRKCSPSSFKERMKQLGQKEAK